MAFQHHTLRIRVFTFCVKEAEATYGHVLMYLEALFYLLANLLLVTGSVMMWPKYRDDYGHIGVWIFTFTPMIDVVAGVHDLTEIMRARRHGVTTLERYEELESLSFIVGASCFVISMVLGREVFGGPDYWWNEGFAIASNSVMIFAAYFNSLGLSADRGNHSLTVAAEKKCYFLTCTALFCTLCGAVFLLMSCVITLPPMAVADFPVLLGQSFLTVGSSLFTMQTLLHITATAIAHAGALPHSGADDENPSPGPEPAPELGPGGAES